MVPLYREVAADAVYSSREEGQVNPAKLLNSFTDSEEQREVASLFNATIHLETSTGTGSGVCRYTSQDKVRKPCGTEHETGILRIWQDCSR